MAEIIDGKALAAKIKREIKAKAEAFEFKHGRKVGLAVVKVGDDQASAVYVRNKIKACDECGVRSIEHFLKHDTQERELLELIDSLNADETVDGILVQLPLPKQIDSKSVLSRISPDKDADGFHAVNAGKLFLGDNPRFVACTPRGIIELIKSTGVCIAGKHAVVVGRSNIVGKPISSLLLSYDATVTVCHSKTKALADFTRQADILVAAIGKAKFITADMIKPGAVVIDVGMNRDEAGKLCGDVDFDKAKDVAGYITPVPGGVGPMTIAMLLSNTVDGAAHE
ncbi:MAG: bifunctional methylenetetrahydrofolate dehydrogenase/methenyltetrahydrofolate cyclohydrolase FolD [Clostridiales bacterium]|nr:bifunctional methylenetetrahydrofolate dehydrogenase/methenyltetrahydrofolate cyclohydrolase FolD [Clostridiales bacterium]